MQYGSYKTNKSHKTTIIIRPIRANKPYNILYPTTQKRRNPSWIPALLHHGQFRISYQTLC